MEDLLARARLAFAEGLRAGFFVAVGIARDHSFDITVEVSFTLRF